MRFLLTQILLKPRTVTELDTGELIQLLRQARGTKLLASLTLRINEEGVLDQLPVQVRRHMDSAVLLHEKQKHDLAYDSSKLKSALDTIEERLILLKGAAYLQARLPFGRGRLISDIDIIVPQSRIDMVEKNLNQLGWESSYENSYNERYYRQWMHEIPPLFDKQRGATLDLHHTILPPTAAPNVNANLLFDDLVEIKPGVFTLSPPDMVIHSATHLFHEGQFYYGLRDLWDLHQMLQFFPEQDTGFWKKLIIRARELDLEGSLYHSLTYSEKFFGTPVPHEVKQSNSSVSRKLRKPIMDFLFMRAFTPRLPECEIPFTSLASNLLYIRSHYLRMPLYLLVPHLIRKAWMGYFEPDGQNTGK